MHGKDREMITKPPKLALSEVQCLFESTTEGMCLGKLPLVLVDKTLSFSSLSGSSDARGLYNKMTKFGTRRSCISSVLCQISFLRNNSILYAVRKGKMRQESSESCHTMG